MVREATAETVLEFLVLINDLEVCIDGGWGVDALLGRQTRPHSDLDLIVDRRDGPVLREIMENASFTRLSLDGEVYEEPSNLRVDVHFVDRDATGWRSFDLGDGREWPFPPSAFAGMGVIAGRSVRCLLPEAQVQCHAQGYAPKEKDLRDMLALQEQFGLLLPLSLGARQRQ